MKWFTAVAFLLIVSACASTSDDSAAQTTLATGPPTVVVSIEEIGGCFVMGPNCATYVVYSDGVVELQRTMEPGEPVDTTTLDIALVDELMNQVAITDLKSLPARLTAGECQSCYDGIDTTLTYETPTGRVSFASADVELTLTEPLFKATWAIRDAAAAVLELPMLQRP